MFLILCFCLLSIVSLSRSSEVCDNAPEYTSCSINAECGCLQYSGTMKNTGICGLKTLSCSTLKPCSSTGHQCADRNHVCIRHPLCDFRSVCYPLNKANEQSCPTFQTSTMKPSYSSCDWIKDSVVVSNELKNPTGLFLNTNNDGGLEISVADSGNHRIVKWTSGEQSLNSPVFVSLNGTGQLSFYPRDIVINQTDGTMFICDTGSRRIVRVMNNSKEIQTLLSNVQCESLLIDNEGSLIASELDKDRVTKWEKINQFSSDQRALAGASGKGSNLNQLNQPRDILFDQRDNSIYIADSANHRIVKWIEGKKEGVIVAGGHGRGNASHQLAFPNGIALHSNGDLYIADTDNHRIVRWTPGATSGTVLVETNLHNPRQQRSQPFSLVFDQQYHNLYVTDWANSHLLRFFIDGVGNCGNHHQTILGIFQ